MFRGARSIAAAWCLAAGLFMGPTTASEAADFEVHPLDSGEMMIALVGEITTGDAEKFRKLAITHPKAFLLLGSNGGTIVEALEIGRIVRLQGYVTLVVRDAPATRPARSSGLPVPPVSWAKAPRSDFMLPTTKRADDCTSPAWPTPWSATTSTS